MKGTLISFNKRFGFIRPDDVTFPAVFAHKSEFFGKAPTEKLVEPRRVTYDLSQHRGKTVATAIRFVS